MKVGECAGCGKDLMSENFSLADGCECNTPRGINHGVVPKDVCTCDACDTEKTGGSRYQETWRDRKPLL